MLNAKARVAALRRPSQRRGTPIEPLERRLLMATFDVNTTADTGAGSLRQAIDDANLAVGLDDITFTLPTGPQTISPATPLPALTDVAGVVIHGESQPGFDIVTAVPIITIDGTSAGAGAIGLQFTSGNNIVRGLIVQNFTDDQIQTSGLGGNNSIVGNVLLSSGPASDALEIGTPDTVVGTPNAVDRNILSNVFVNAANDSIIENNRIGTDAAGTAALPNARGLTINGATGVGVFTNLISGNTGSGISLISAGNAFIQANKIGTTDDGLSALSNTGDGITIDNSTTVDISANVISANAGAGITVAPGSSGEIRSNVIGTNGTQTNILGNGQQGIIVSGAAGILISDNTIGGNADSGIVLEDGAINTIIQSNFIGTDDGGAGTDLGNTGSGVVIGATVGAAVTGTQVGGVGPGQANIIAFNGGRGVYVNGATHVNNAILQNSIFANDLLGIDLSPPDGNNTNDNDDPDAGANNLQNFPSLIQAVFVTGNLAVAGSIDSTPNSTLRLEFFSSVSGATDDGANFLGFTSVTTGADGAATFNAVLGGGTTPGQAITATATDSAGNSSEFSAPVVAGVAGADLVVTGNGVTIASSDTTPSSIDATDFGSITLGAGSLTRIFTLTNSGQAQLDLSAGVQLVGGGGQFVITDQPDTTLAPSAATTFTVVFTPAAAGNQIATIQIASNDPVDIPYNFAIQAQGLAIVPAPEIEVSGNGNPIANGDISPSGPDATDLGSAGIGDAPATATYTIINAGQLNLNIGTVTITGGNGFSVQTQPATVLGPGQTTTFTIRFAPSAGGQFAAVVNVPNDDANENPYTFTIRGTGVPGGGTPPTATLLPQDQQPEPIRNSTVYEFIIRYNDDQGLSVGTFDSGDIIVTLPDSSTQNADFVRIQSSTTGQADVVYRINAPGGTLDPSDDGAYLVALRDNQVADTGGLSAAAANLGSFTLDLTTARALLGEFGFVNGRRQKLVIAEIDGTVVTLSLTNGTGRAFSTPANRLDLEMTSTEGKFVLGARLGNGRAELGDVRVVGSLRSFKASRGDIAGVLVAPRVDMIILGSTNGATISTRSPIQSLKISGDMINTQVFSGADLGADGRFGGTGVNTDVDFGAGSIVKFNVSGSITNSVIAAGLDPVDGILLNENGIIVGGPTSLFRTIKVRRSVDSSTVFAAGAFPTKVKLDGLTIFPPSDQRFDSTP